MASNVVDGLFYRPLTHYIKSHFAIKASSLYSVAVISGAVAMMLWACGIRINLCVQS